MSVLLNEAIQVALYLFSVKHCFTGTGGQLLGQEKLLISFEVLQGESHKLLMKSNSFLACKIGFLIKAPQFGRNMSNDFPFVSIWACLRF